MRILLLFIMIAVGFVSHAENLCYYRLVSITQNGTTKTDNISGGQFVKFIGDICYECDNSGVGVGHGTLKKTSSDSQQTTYKGGSYLGYPSFFRFNSDKSELKMTNSDGSVVYTFRKATAPTSQATSSLIRDPNAPAVGNGNGGGVYVPATPATTTTPSSTRSQHKCTVCNGTGQVIRLHPSSGQKKWCGQCNQQVPTGHRHEMCSYCYGKGYVEY